jgi:hypothetical protein
MTQIYVFNYDLCGFISVDGARLKYQQNPKRNEMPKMFAVIYKKKQTLSASEASVLIQIIYRIYPIMIASAGLSGPSFPWELE